MRLLPLLVFWCLWFLNFFTRTSFSPILPLIEDALSLTHGEAGGLILSFSLGYSVTLLIAGRYVSVWGYKRTVFASITGLGIVLTALQGVDHYLGYHALFLLLGLSAGCYLPAILPIITEMYESSHWGKAIGLHDSAASVAFLSAPILIAFGLQFLPWKRILFLLGLACLMIPFLFWKVAVEPRPAVSRVRSRYLDLFRRKPILIMIGAWILAAATNIGVYSILPLYLIKERGMNYATANNLVGISRIGGIAVQICIGFLVDRFGYSRLIFLSLFTAGLSTIFLAIAPNPSILTVLIFIQAAFSLAFFPVGLAAIAKLTTPEERPMGIGAIISSGVIFGTGGAPFLLGLIADHASFTVGLLGLGGVTVLSTFMFRFLRET
jgi:NNP family nitrate/nitrite transporter-like MFS transporter